MEKYATQHFRAERCDFCHMLSFNNVPYNNRFALSRTVTRLRCCYSFSANSGEIENNEKLCANVTKTQKRTSTTHDSDRFV